MTQSSQRQELPINLAAQGAASFSLLSLAAQVRREDAYATGGKSGLTLVRQPDLTVVLTVVKQGVEIHEHKAHAPATVVVLEGAIDFQVADHEPLYLETGATVLFDAEVPHRVSAKKDSAFLLVIGGHRA